jgi:hypothetical protein
MIAEMAIECLLGNVPSSLHRVWAGRKTLVEASGGAWTDPWLPIAGDRGAGSFVEELRWPIDSECDCKAGIA